MANKFKIKTNKVIRPVIYCYITPNDKEHIGYCKIGYTESETADECIYHQSRRTDTKCVKKWESLALFEGDYRPFMDHAFGDYLVAIGIERKESVYKGKRQPEYYKISPEDAKMLLVQFKERVNVKEAKKFYRLRQEQKDAVKLTKDYVENATVKEKVVLLNAKPRFGKCLTMYQYIQENNAQKVLILSQRPVASTSWYSDWKDYLDKDEFLFVSHCDDVKNLEGCIKPKDYFKMLKDGCTKKAIVFISIQDLIGSKWFSNHRTQDKFKEVSEINWDLLVLDEAHEATETDISKVAFSQINRELTVLLTGTASKQLANKKIPKEAIFNWTYMQEQEAKLNWNEEEDGKNPYGDLPQIHIVTYNMANMFLENPEEMLDEKVVDERNKFFNQAEFFRVENNKFVHEQDVIHFLDVISSNPKYILGSEENRAEIPHSLFLLDRVDSAKLLSKELRRHPNFQDYHIELVAGDGKIDENDLDKLDKAFKRVKDSIGKYEKTITISVKRLTTAVTIPDWCAVFMLCNWVSVDSCFQAMLRAQNPCLIKSDNGTFIRKENCYIIDFNPHRMLNMIDKFANDFYYDTADGGGNSEQRKQHIDSFLKYAPVYGEDDLGDLVLYDSLDIIQRPIKIQAVEIARHGFMSPLLLNNIGRLLNDPRATEILRRIKEQKGNHTLTSTEELSYDDNGNTKVDNEIIDKKSDEIVQSVSSDGSITSIEDNALDLVETLTEDIDKISEKTKTDMFLEDVLEEKNNQKKEKEKQKKIEKFIDDSSSSLASSILSKIDNFSGQTKSLNDKNYKRLKEKVEVHLKEVHNDFGFEEKRAKDLFAEKYSKATNEEDKKKVVEEYFEVKDKQNLDFACRLTETVQKVTEEIVEEEVTTLEVKRQEKVNKQAEDDFGIPKIKALCRSVSSLLLAYGDENTTCDKFAEIVPPNRFIEMTGIEIDDYNYLLGQDYFNRPIFDAAIKEFFNIYKRDSNYLYSKEDIFDIVAVQKTNQRFTSKRTVKIQLDILQRENPNCFSDYKGVFIDTYMKSGSYLAEVIKRLFHNVKMRAWFPDDKERLQHILENQIYGIAPTEIIYRISKKYILSVAKAYGIPEENCHIVLCEDIEEVMAKGKLNEKIQELFNS